MPSVQQMIQVGLDVLGTAVDAATKVIRANIGDVKHESTEFDSAEWWQHVGFSSRPRKPEPGKQSAQVVTVRRSDFDACVASRDVRDTAIFGDLDHGETTIYAAGSNGSGTARISLRGSDKVEIKNANARIEIKPDGSVAITNSAGTISIDAAGSVKLGLTAPQFGVVNELGLASYLAISNTLVIALGAFAADPAIAALAAATAPALATACGVYASATGAATPFVSSTVTSSP